jgi:RHS repeat-associated protein
VVLQENHYDPYGLALYGIEKDGVSNHQYKFNEGSELNNSLDLNWYETDFRTYDPQLGRFHQVDLLCFLSPSISNYSFASNNPIVNSDPSGLADAPSPFLQLWRKFRLLWVSDGDYININVRRNDGTSYTSRLYKRKDSGGSKGNNSGNGSEKNTQPVNNQQNHDNFVQYHSFDKMPMISYMPNTPSIDFGDLNLQPIQPNPKYEGNPIIINKLFTENSIFYVNRTNMTIDEKNDRIIGELLKSLTLYPQLTLTIYGNAGSDNGKIHHLNQIIDIDEGRGTVRELMLGRANTIRRTLIRKGISPERLKVMLGRQFPDARGYSTSFKFDIK